MPNILHFRTNAAANLFINEITGQLADGAWENTKPYDHWKYWCDAEVVVDGKIGHEGYPKKKNYNLKSLKKYVKDRMLNLIRVTKTPWYDIKYAALAPALSDDFYLNCTPSNLERRKNQTTPESVKEHYSCLVQDRLKRALDAIGQNVSEDFKKILEDEIINQMCISQNKTTEDFNKYVEENWKILNEIGIPNEEARREELKKITEIKVTDFELDDALNEISEMMQKSI